MMADLAVQIASQFEIAATEFIQTYQGQRFQIRYRGATRNAELWSYTQENSRCIFTIILHGDDGEEEYIDVAPEWVNIGADQGSLQALVEDVNNAIARFNQTLRGKKGMVYNRTYRIWMDVTIVDLELENDAFYNIDYGHQHFESLQRVSALEVRLRVVPCGQCGSIVPSDYLGTHKDEAVHLGDELERIYLRFLKEFKGIEVTVRGQRAILEDAYLPWMVGNFRSRLRLIENANQQEIIEDLENIPALAGISSAINDVLLKFNRSLDDLSAISKDIVNDVWDLVFLVNIAIMHEKCATYLVEYDGGNRRTEFVPADQVRVDFRECHRCQPHTFWPIDEYQGHVGSHSPDSGIVSDN